jgi:GBP family porin
MKKKLLAASLAGALSAALPAAFAADVSVYGVADTGLTYTHVKHGTDTLEMSTGNYAGSRFGLKGRETLASGAEVGFVLEAGYLSDSGEFGESRKLFNREVLLNVKTAAGTFGAGRTGPFTSGTGSLSRYWDLEAFETGYTDAGIQATQVNIWKRHSNTVYWISPKISGWETGLQYSFAGNADQETTGLARDDHFANAYVRWDGEAFRFALGAEYYRVGHDAEKQEPNDDRLSIKLAGAWTPDAGTTQLYAGFNYYKDQPQFSDSAWADLDKLSYDDSGDGLTGTAFYLGVKRRVGAAQLMLQAQYLDGENKGAPEGTQDDFSRWVVGVGAHYFFSKRTMGYLVGSYAHGTGLLGGDAQTNRSILTAGVTHWF